jgi:hypothetical protein
MDFIINLSLSKLESSVYNIVLVVVDRYTKVARYLSIIKIVDAVDVFDLIYYNIFLVYR